MPSFAPSGRRQLHREAKSILTGLAWISPWLLGFLVFLCAPILMSAYYSLTDYALIDKPVFVGLDNYRELASDSLFFVSLRNTLFYAVLSVIGSTALSVSLAILLEQRLRGAALVRSIIFVPTLVPVVANCVTWLWLLNPQYGLVSSILNAIGIHDVNLLGDRTLALPTFAIMGLWVIGSPLLVCSAALKEVPASLYEAADLDGMSPLQVLAPPMIMTRGGPENATLTYSMYVYKTAFEFGRMGYASALAWVQIILTAAIAVVVLVVARRLVYYRGA